MYFDIIPGIYGIDTVITLYITAYCLVYITRNLPDFDFMHEHLP